MTLLTFFIITIILVFIILTLKASQVQMAEAGIALEVTEGQCSELAAGGDSLWVCSNGQASGSKCIMQCQEGFMNSGSAVQMTCACRNGDCEWKSNNEFRVRNLLNFA